jgi:hypothetical protein
MSDAKAYLKSVVGCLPTDAVKSSWPKVLDISHSCHFVSISIAEKYECDCKHYWSDRECSHVEAAKHLDLKINLQKLMQKIDRPRVTGRPRIHVPVGYAAHQPVLTASREIQAANYIGARVARYIRGDRERLYVGTIVGNMF